jgi:hypothetical protein
MAIVSRDWPDKKIRTKYPKFIVINPKHDQTTDYIEGKVTIDVLTEIAEFIVSQTQDQWVRSNIDAWSGDMCRFIITEQLLSWIELKYG